MKKIVTKLMDAFVARLSIEERLYLIEAAGGVHPVHRDALDRIAELVGREGGLPFHIVEGVEELWREARLNNAKTDVSELLTSRPDAQLRKKLANQRRELRRLNRSQRLRVQEVKLLRSEITFHPDTDPSRVAREVLRVFGEKVEQG